MTRGTLILILEGAVFESMEFNGGMSPENFGQTAIEMLAKVTTAAEFEEMVAEFNTVYHCYDDDEIVFDKDNFFDGDHSVNFGRNFFDRFFSDYLYILNRSGKEIQATGKDGKAFVIPVDMVTGVDFGKHISDLEAPIVKN
jgi:hypothetical protein